VAVRKKNGSSRRRRRAFVLYPPRLLVVVLKARWLYFVMAYLLKYWKSTGRGGLTLYAKSGTSKPKVLKGGDDQDCQAL
jgi:hypothetical protein